MNVEDDKLKIDTSKSTLIIEGDEKEQEDWSKRVDKRAEVLRKDQSDRKPVLEKRYNYYVGKQGDYTNIVNGKANSQKKGWANAVYNYAGKTVTKIVYSLANNPPKFTIPGRKVPMQYMPSESARAQGVEDFIDTVLKENRFFKKAYRRGCFNQVAMGDTAIKIYPVNKGTKENPDWFLKITNHENMANLLVGWRGDDPSDFDYVIAEEQRSIQSIEEEYGVKFPDNYAGLKKDNQLQPNTTSSHDNNNQWGTDGAGTTTNLPPSGKNNIPSVSFLEYDDDNVYIIKIDGKLVQLVHKDADTFPKIGFWIIVPNIPNPKSPWSIADIDYMMDPQTEFNETSNDERNYIRVGANQKYVAYNMNEFDPESVKTGSGAVIFVDSPDNSSRFEPLQTNVNSFPVDSYINRIQEVMYDLGIPKVTFGGGGADSGRSKAIDYQSLVDLTQFKRDSWELAMDQLYEKIQRFGAFYFPEATFFKDPEMEQFVVRYPEFDWSDILPITEADKIVNILNKVTMGLPFKRAFQELGYRDVEGIIQEMREEAKDEDLMAFRSKMWQLTGGIMGAQQRAQQLLGQMEQMPSSASPGAPSVNTPSPTLTSNQNEGRTSSLPMSQKGGTSVFSSAEGTINRAKQNLEAAGR